MTNVTSRILSAVIRQLKQRPSFEAVGIQQYRALLEKSALVFKPDKSVQIQEADINNITAAWLTPENYSSRSIVLYIHGGGFIAGSIKSHRDLASRIAVASRSKTLIINYRLAPENKFPAGFNDVSSVYEWLLENHGFQAKISIVGDSAGGNLVLSVLSSLLSQNKTLPCCAAVISPWADLECKSNSHVEKLDKDPMLNREVLNQTARLYTDKDLSSPLISPLNNDFTGLCPLLIHVGKNEVLLDDSKILANKTKAAGVDAAIEIYEEMFHVWHYFAKYLPQGREAIDKIGLFIQKYSQ